MSRGRRYSQEGKLNLKKVFAVAIACIVLIIAILMIKNILTKAKNTKQVQVVEYFALYKDEKWGILGSDGNVVIEPMYEEMPIVIDKTKDVFLCTYDIDEGQESYKTKVVNSKNEEIWTNYDKIEALENYDKAENIWYEENVLKVQKDGLWGLIDLTGKEILSPTYTNIQTLKGIQNSLIVQKDNLYGLVNGKGTKILDTEYLQIMSFGGDYQNGYIVVNQENKYGIVNSSGATILDTAYEKVEDISSDKYFVIKENGIEKLINKAGEVVLSGNFDEITQIANSGVVINKNGKFGVLDFEGNIKIEAKYEELREINTDVFLAKQDGKYGVIDIQMQERIPYIYNGISYNKNAGIYIAEDENYISTILNSNFEVKFTGILSQINIDEGYLKIKIQDEYKYYNFKFEEKDIKDILISNKLFVAKQDGKYGFMDSKGNLKVDYIYEDAQEFNKYGFAAVKKDGQWGAINSKGEVIIEPSYNLDENLVIDFIGRWHLGVDLNMNYYCEK